MNRRLACTRHAAFLSASALLCLPLAVAQNTARTDPPPTLSARDLSSPPAATRLADDVYCGDAVSEALHSNTPEMPCWADLRSVDRFRAAPVQGGELLRPQSDNGVQSADFRRASVTAGLIGGTSFLHGPNPQGYGGIAAVAGTIGHRRWQLSAEDVGSGADLRSAGSNRAVALNRGTLRFRAATTPRFVVQARVTNSYGTDAYRLLAPLDYRMVGTSQVPVADTASYGLHAGRVLSGQEDVSTRYAATRRTSWDVSAAHSIRNYSDVGATVQTLRARAAVLHAVSPGFAMGVFATAATQTSAHTALATAPACSLAGGGFTAESRWQNRLTFDLEAGAAGSTSGCGDTLQAIGRASLSLRASSQTTVYVAADRDLGAGILLSVPMLNSASVGLRHALGRSAGFNVDAGGLLGSNPNTRQQSSAVFADADIHYRIGAHLVQQTSIRRFQSSRFDRVASQPGGQTAVTFSLWFTTRAAEGQGR